MDEKSSVQEPKSVEKELLLLDLRRIFWLAPLGLLLTFALLATMHFLKRDLTLEGFSLVVPEPAVVVQAGRTVPEIRDGLVPSLVRAGARARAVARVRQSGHDRRHGDDAGVRRLVEGHGSRGGLHEDRSVVLVWFHDG
jgi:hypothetical protein